jgi:non-heme chloroperoxidase
MFKVLVGLLTLLPVLALIPVAVIAFSAPSSPPAMSSVAGPLSRVNFDDVPAPQYFQARDRSRLQYYAYPASPDKVAVLIHGSAGPGTSMHALAKTLRDAGARVCAARCSGHEARTHLLQ